MAKKYVLDYGHGSTGYGWQKEYDTLDEFESFVDAMEHEYNASIQVWDNEIQKFIYWKDILTYRPRIDMLHDFLRDMRTKTRRIKECQMV